MRQYLFIIITALIVITGCNKDSEFLTQQPSDMLTDEQVWQHSDLVLSVLADLYARYPDAFSIEGWVEFTNLDEAFPSQASEYWRTKDADYPYEWWNYWDYAYLREINLFIEKCNAADKLPPADRERFLAEARFLRAAFFFEEVKRMGGVPLILEPMEYDFSGDPTYLRHPRAKESEVYDFVLQELDSIKTKLPNDGNIKSRATKGLALAMKARAALYAGSIAKYGAGTPAVSTPGGEVGIPASMAAAYYQASLQAAQELISDGRYSLYMKKEDDLEDNFSSLFIDKNNNPEVIFVEDFKLKSGKVQGWTLANQPRSSSEEQEGGRINPSLNLVQEFEKLDNTFAPLPNTDANGEYIYYDELTDIFAGRDARLGATVILPGTSFKGFTVDIWAGYLLPNGSIISGDNFGQRKRLPGRNTEEQVVGFDGPIDGLQFSAQTGFYVRKFMDPSAGSGRIGTQSEVWWVRYRYAEVLLNAAEAAFELGQPEVAAGYINQVRRRAGFATDLTPGQITFDRIVHERKVELAFEGHQLWDIKRWRLAHRIFNGVSMSAADLVTNIGKADKRSTMMYGLWPYRIFNPGHPTDGKWVFRIVKPANVTNPHRFRLGNYYSQINADILSNNPKLVKNPNQ